MIDSEKVVAIGVHVEVSWTDLEDPVMCRLSIQLRQSSRPLANSTMQETSGCCREQNMAF